MKIAFIYDVIYPYVKGGVEKRNYELAKELTKRGHEVHIFGMNYWRGKDIIKKEGIWYHGVCKPQKLYKESNGKRSIKEPIHFSLKLFKPLIKEKFDIIDCSNIPYFPALTTRLVTLLKGEKMYITWHEVWGNYWFEYLGWKGFFGYTIEFLTQFLTKNNIAVSERTKKRLLFKEKCTLITNGVNIFDIENSKRAKKFFDVLFVGRLVNHKNVDLLISAVGEKYSLGIIGDGPERINLEKQCLGRKNIHFLGSLEKQEEVYGYMKNTKVLAIPSTREGFGIVAIEANATGTPIVTVEGKDNAIVDLISSYKNGIVCKLDQEELKKALELSFKKHSSMRKYSKIYAKRFSWNHLGTELEKVYGYE